MSTEPSESSSVRPTLDAIPEHGTDHDLLRDALEALSGDDADWRGGRVFSLVYSAGDAHTQLLKDAHMRYFSENALNPMAFKSLRRMESDVVAMSADMLHGDAQVVGTMTSGGTESLLLPIKTYRDRARRLHPRIKHPEVVLPRSAHPALDKASHYFGVKLRYAPLDDQGHVSLRALKRLINKNTIALVGSAPQYPHGIIDPIEELGQIAQKARLPLHVDACIGGFMLPWLEALGEPIRPWDFRVPGVTSISADLHKYGYAAKGASVLLYRNMSYLRDQFYASTDWPGGIYISPSIPGTRPGGPIAAAWVALQAMGREGYIAHTRTALATHRKLKAGISAIPGLRVVGSEHTLLLCFASSDPAIDIYAVADQLEDAGWHVDRQQGPPSLHHTVTSLHEAIADDYLKAIARAVAFVREHPETKSRGNAAMYGMMAKIPFKGMVQEAVLDVMEQLYGRGEGGSLQDSQKGFVGALIRDYGDQVMQVLDKVDMVKTKLQAFDWRRR